MRPQAVQYQNVGEYSQSGFNSSLSHLSEELKRLDLVIQRRICQFRELNAQGGLHVSAAPAYVSDQEVDWLLTKQWEYISTSNTIEELNKSIDAIEVATRDAIDKTYECSRVLPLVQLASLFGLSWLEVQFIIVCLAPELRRSYDRLYAYLQDDITRKRPSIDLVLELFVDSEQERWYQRGFFSNQSKLFRHGLLQMQDDLQSPSGSSGLAKMLRLDNRILEYLLGNNTVDSSIDHMTSILDPNNIEPQSQLDHDSKFFIDDLIEEHFFKTKKSRPRMLLHVYGPKGVGKKSLVLNACKKIGCPMLVINVPALLSTAENVEEAMQRICRESLLLQALLYFEDVDSLISNESVNKVHLSRLMNLVQEYSWLTVFSGFNGWQPNHSSLDPGGELVFASIEVPVPEVELRKQIWSDGLLNLPVHNKDHVVADLACKFSLTPGQIERSVQTIQMSSLGSETNELDIKKISEACRKQFNQGLNKLATKVTPGYNWGDLVLREDTTELLKSVCSQARYKHQVFKVWGFDEKMAYGRGLSVLFSGSPGTGKTMAAQVMANDLQLDLYKIDLSGVVSKYIGETEKNLDNVFKEAETSNAILFFDEADALFGKRTEVSDAHDRYANIEVSFLLQKIEEYDGIVILATNFRNNIDDAFVRRIRFITEFPFPDQSSRLKIWQKSVPDKAPLSEDVDFSWLSAKIKVSGGNIKNIVLNAAFSAAQEKTKISMRHLISSSQQEFGKIGKLWDERNMNYLANIGLG